MKATPTVIIVEDDNLLRATIRQEVTQRGLHVLADCADSQSGISAIRELKPMLAILDYRIDHQTGSDICLATTKHSPKTQYIMFTGTDEIVTLSHMLMEAPIAALIHKENLTELWHGINMVLDGQLYISPKLTQELLFFERMARELNSQQRSILHLISEGRTNEEIAEKLHISTKTVSRAKSRLRQLLGNRIPFKKIA